ncbi:MAG: hypothetical protein ABJN69_04395 [Hellea sp.]
MMRSVLLEKPRYHIMENTSYIVEMLAKLGFSFWQVLILLIAAIYRTEVKNFFKRITSLKVAGSEIELESHNQVGAELVELRDEVRKPKADLKNIEKLIDERISKRIIGSLVNIKKNTSFLWNTGFKENLGVAKAQIRKNTLMRILPDLEFLEELKLIKTSKSAIGSAFDADLVYEFKIAILDDELHSYVLKATEY